MEDNELNEAVVDTANETEVVDTDDWSDVEDEALEMLNNESDEDSEDKPAEANEESQKVNNDSNETVETPSTSDDLEVVYNGETIKVSKDDAKIYTQKGMNYDKLKEKYDKDPARAFVERLAKAEGKSVEDYIAQTDESIKDFNIRQLAEEQGVSIEVATKLYEYENSQKEMSLASEKITAEQKERDERDAQFRDFNNAYPDVKPEEIPMSVWNKFNQGVPLKYAFMEYENETLKTNNKQLQTNATNRQQEITVGSSNAKQKQKEDWEAIWDED